MLIPPRVNPHPPPPPPGRLVTEVKVRALLKSDWLYQSVSPEAKARLVEEHVKALH